MKYARILKASKSQAIDAVIENLPVTANGYFLDATQMDNIEQSLEAGETAANALATANETIATHESTIATLTTERDNNATALATANETIATLTSEKAALQAEVNTLGGKADPPGETNRKKDPAPGGKKRMNSMDAYAAQYGH